MSDPDNENNEKIIRFPGSKQILADKLKNKPYPSAKGDTVICDDIQYTSIREEVHDYTIRIMEGHMMLGFNPSYETLKTAKKAAKTNLLPEDKIGTTIAVIDNVNGEIHIVIGNNENLIKDPLFKKQFGDFKVNDKSIPVSPPHSN